MSKIHQCPSCPRTLEFFTGTSTSRFGAWTEIVYQAADGRVGFQIDKYGQEFLRELLRESWALDRGKRLFSEVDPDALNFHNLHNEAAIAAILPKKPLLAEFDCLAEYEAAQKRNALRARLGKGLLEIDEPRLFCCTNVETREVGTKCLEAITRECEVCLLLRASEYGLTGALFSQSPQNLSTVISDAALSVGLQVVTVELHEELPCW